MSRHIPSLDGIRAVSFLLVFVAHAGLDRYVPGGMGVTIFFFLSGFLITSLMRLEYDQTGTLNLKHFWARRALRIFPPFYVVLFVAVLVSSGVTLAPFLAQVLHVTNYWIIYRGYHGMAEGTGVYWSLAVEEHFYLLFPWVFIAMQRMHPKNQAILLYVACAVVLAWRCVLVEHFHSIPDRTYMATDTRIDSIIFGCALAMWNSPVIDKRDLNERRWVWYTLMALGVLGLCLMIRNDVFRETLRYSLQGAALTVVFIAAIRFNKWLPMRLLNSKALIFIGTLSYSLYLLHLQVIFMVQRSFLPHSGQLVQGIVALALSTVCAYAIYLAIEKPCAGIRRRMAAAVSDGSSYQSQDRLTF